MHNGLSMGDYLHNFMAGLTNALVTKGRSVITITLESLNARSLGMIIALYERAVAFYAELININAFHQPGVQAYKKASNEINDLNLVLQEFIAGNKGFRGSSNDFADKIKSLERIPDVEGILSKFSLNHRTFETSFLSRDLIDGRWIFTVKS